MILMPTQTFGRRKVVQNGLVRYLWVRETSSGGMN
jgi:hypothetical protein